MYAVIFKAKLAAIDEQYASFAQTLRALAFEKYGCTEFVSASEGGQEIAISYWPSEQAIIEWKNDAQHQTAQKFGQQTWYEAYQVEIVKVLHEYQYPTSGLADD